MKRTLIVLLGVVALVGLCAAPAHGQRLESLTAGARVRTRQGYFPQEYRLAAVESAHLSLRDGSGAVHRVAIADIDRLWVADGTLSRGRAGLHRAWMFGLAGAVVGGVGGLVSGPSGDSPDESSRGEVAAVNAAYVGVGLAAVGFVYGAVAPGPRWVRVIPPRHEREEP